VITLTIKNDIGKVFSKRLVSSRQAGQNYRPAVF
jgi:hypothetical protein